MSTPFQPRPPIRRRVVVTGVGLVSPLACGSEATWQAALAGRSGIGPITQFDATGYSTRIAGEVTGFDPHDWIEKKDIKKCARFIQFAIAATRMAMDASGLQHQRRQRRPCRRRHRERHRRIRSHRARASNPDGTRTRPRITILYPLVDCESCCRAGVGSPGRKGPNSAVATACTTGAHAIGDAFRIIQGGYADAMICGGTEAGVAPLGVAGFAAMRALSTRDDDPYAPAGRAIASRDGFVVGEGGLRRPQDLEHALGRGAFVLADSSATA